ncbi:hypothetical protein PSTG_18108 [Puccinia striiformis f. sp. tritici PST-78]|uniref:Uncharacterized protein n=1 Tax=Puccinia striiformis f. sp. tritici PST-78 TaxID=1165861 RepID=A0A0L0UNA0_9BASI|nr:hypothetical protein PSTG_18108 [Puccinia striiformis f. sp. tritici PST-78]
MAEGQYQLASEDLEEAISRFDPVMTKKNRSTLITRVFRLVRCYLALLDGRRARCALRKLGVQFSPDEPDSSEYKTLCSRIKLLIAAEKSIEHSRSTDQNWQMAFQLIQSMEKEIMSWGPKFDLALLPGSWTCWKIESLAHLGKTVEAEEVLDQCSKADSSKVNTIKHPGMKSEYQIARAWVDLAKADLSTRVYDALRYAHPAPAGSVSIDL